MGWDMGGSFKSEGAYVYLWLIHVDAWQKPEQYCKAIIQLKKKKHDVEKHQNIKLAKNYTWVTNSFKDTQLYYK